MWNSVLLGARMVEHIYRHYDYAGGAMHFTLLDFLRIDSQGGSCVAY